MQKTILRTTSLLFFSGVIGLFGQCRSENPMDGQWRITNTSTGDTYDWNHLDDEGAHFQPTRIHNLCDWIQYHQEQASPVYLEIAGSQLRLKDNTGKVIATMQGKLNTDVTRHGTYSIDTPPLLKSSRQFVEQTIPVNSIVKATLQKGELMLESEEGVSYRLKRR
ncbi:hypothetical protein [Spirosoma fluviale]|uniref:Uncharacterized protein n=1 Tax=Spirosoma fluviale TaxID=1597977 RepID=A0A286GLK7_9BACT|nr:hypothetical protein [Spirosoma fluviale]SOD96421.1 hypothetical protein SAMN06269250_5301 [Spirosoma fluviale]